jgi:hypothetical protein
MYIVMQVLCLGTDSKLLHRVCKSILIDVYEECHILGCYTMWLL